MSCLLVFFWYSNLVGLSLDVYTHCRLDIKFISNNAYLSLSLNFSFLCKLSNRVLDPKCTISSQKVNNFFLSGSVLHSKPLLVGKETTLPQTQSPCSGVTRVGVTRGGKWWVSPHFFFQKIRKLFLRGRMSPPEGCHPGLFSSRLLTTPTSPRRLSSFFVNSATTKLLLGRVSHPEGCHPGRPPTDATASLVHTAPWYSRFECSSRSFAAVSKQSRSVWAVPSRTLGAEAAEGRFAACRPYHRLGGWWR